MSNERTPAEALKRRILSDTGDQIGTAARAIFDVFTGGAEAVAESVAADIEAKQRGERGAEMLPRYRCEVCRGVHLAGQPCDRLVHAVHDTEPAPAPTEVVETRLRRLPPVRVAQGVPLVTGCEACALETLTADAFVEATTTSTTFARANLRACEKCLTEQPGHAPAYSLPR